VIDCLRLLITRPLQGRAFFEGGRDHFHHRLIDSLGKRLSAATYIFAVAASSIIVTLNPKFSLLTLCGLCAFYFTFARLSEGSSTHIAQSGDDDILQGSLNVVSINEGRGRDAAQSWAMDGS